VARAQACSTSTGGSGFQEVPIVNGLEGPMSFTEDPATGLIFIVEKAGALKVFDPLDTSITTVATLAVRTDAELGLLGIALDPAFSTNGYVFLYYTKDVSGQPVGTLSRFTVTDSPSWALSNEQVLLTIPHIVNYHDAGDLKFGPDNNLYLSTGSNDFAFGPLYGGCNYNDAGSDCARVSSSEKNDLRGKIIRITPTAGGGYTIPSGNMFPVAAGQRGEFLSMGHRNPFRISIDPVIPGGATIPTLYVAEVGTRYEEINRVTNAGYYGWPIFEGPCALPYSPVAGLPADRDPWLWYHQDNDTCDVAHTSSVTIPNLFDAGIANGKSAMAGPVYHYSAGVTNPRKLPASFDNDLFFWDFSKGLVYNINIGAGGSLTSVERFAGDIDFHESNIVDMELGRDHALYILELAEGQISRLDYAPPGTNASPIAYAGATPTAGSAPLAVTFTACPAADRCTSDPDVGETATLTYSWDFDGNGTADATGLTAAHTYAAGAYNAVLSVTDIHGAKTTTGIRITSGNQPSTVTVSSPTDGGLFNWGDNISLTASVSDPEDGSTPVGIPCSDVEITSYFGHDTHKHNIRDTWACTDSLTFDSASGKDEAFYYYAFRVQYADNPVGAVPSVKSATNINLYPKRTQAEHGELSANLRIASTSVPYVGGGKMVTDIADGQSLILRGRNLSGIGAVRYFVASGTSGGTIELRRDSAAGALLATTSIPNTGGFDTYRMIETSFAPPSGKHDLYFLFKGGFAGDPDLFDLDAIEFDGAGVSQDLAAPTLLSASSDRDPNKVYVTFSEPVDTALAQNLANYTFPLGLASATLQLDRQTVVLVTTTALSVGTSYNLTVSNVQDDAGNTIAFASASAFTHRGFDVTGGIDAIWQLDEASGTSALDSSGHSYTGTLMGGATRTTGALGGAVALDGLDDYIDVPDRSYSGDFTVAAWVFLDPTIDNKDAIVGQIGVGQDINFWNSQLRFYTGGGDAVVATTPIQTGVWTHCAITRQGATMRAYMNGQEEGTGDWAGAFTPKALGRGSAGFLDGALDDVRFYSRALSAAELARLSDPTAGGMAGHWELDDGYGTTAKDTSGYSLDGTLYGRPSWENGIRGGALALDGANDVVKFSTISLTSDFTVAGWVKLEGLIDNADALFGMDGVGSDINFYAGYARFYAFGTGDVVVAATPMSPNVWTHVAVTRSAGQAKIYLDGALDATSGITYNGSFNPRSIGRGNQGFLGGLVDDVRVYKRALSPSEVDALASAKTPGLFAHWTMDDGSGAVATDASYNSNDASLAGHTWTTAGQNRGAVTLNGTTGWGNPTDINLGTGDFTIASWVKLTGTIDNQDAIVGQIGAGCDINFWAQKPRLYTGAVTGDIAVATQTVTAGTWAHVAVTRKEGRVHIYRDGTKDAGAGATGCWSGTMPVAAIGRGTAGFLAGTLDDVRVYNTGLRGSDIEHLADDFPSQLAAFYTFNDGTGTDVSGNSNSASAVGAPVWAQGTIGGAAQLNGTTQWFNNPDISLSGDFTITFWLNLDPGISNADGVVGQEGPGADINFYLGFMRLYTGTSDVAVSGTAATASTWQHWSVVRSGSTVRSYLNQTQVGSGTYSGTFIVKALGRGSAGFLGGKLDDLRIYTRALSSAEL